jgi:hypothetical protein
MRASFTMPRLCLPLILLLASTLASADSVLAWVGKTGDVRFGRGVQLDEWPPRLGGSAPLRLELNAHAVDWQHIPQADFVVTKFAKPNAQSRVIAADLVVPGETPANLGVYEQLQLAGSSLTATYYLRAREPLKLCGLQMSLLMDCGPYAGATLTYTGLKTIVAGRTAPDMTPYGTPAPTDGLPDFAEAPPTTLLLPLTESANHQLSDVYCDKLTVTGGTGLPFTLTSTRPIRVVVQDNRKWGVDQFEIRLALIMLAEGRDVPAETEFNAGVTVDVGEALALRP